MRISSEHRKRQNHGTSKRWKEAAPLIEARQQVSGALSKEILADAKERKELPK
jgi:hypothetical protein